MSISLPFFKQHTNYSCGPSSLEMVLSFLGDKKSEIILRKKLHTEQILGTKHEWMIKVATQEGFFCYVNCFSSIYEIKHFLSLKLPVIIDYTEPSSNEGHYAVVVGYLKNKLILNDPWNGKHFKISEQKFMNRWHDNLTKSYGWIMVISKNDFQMGKQYLPVHF